MSDREALYRAIVDAPDDDAPRLVFADWLEENGEEERAHFIRKQIALAKLPEYDPQHFLWTSEASGSRLKAPDVAYEEFPGGRWLLFLHRGFQEELILYDAEELLPAAEQVFGKAPIRRISYGGWRDASHKALWILKRLRQVRVWQFHSNSWPNPDVVLEILSNPLLKGVTEVQWPAGPVPPEVIAALTGDLAVRPRTLSFSGLDLTGHGVELLAASPFFSELRELDLAENPLEGASVSALEKAGVLSRLTRLRLWRAPVGTDAARLIVSLRLPCLESLDLSDTDMSLQDLRDLLDSPVAEGLRELRIGGLDLRNDLGTLLTNADRLRNLVALDVSGNNLRQKGLQALLDAPWLSNLIHLDLSKNPLGEKGAAMIAGCERLGGLGQLMLGDCELKTTGIQSLLASTRLTGLRVLGLYQNRAWRGLGQPLLDSPLAARIEHMDLNGNTLLAEERGPVRARFGKRVRFHNESTA